MKKNVYADNCPAEKIREYIEDIISLQKDFIIKGKKVPKEFLIPSKIELSPENIKFLINSKLVDYIGAGETGKEINFYWKKTDDLPALELRTRLENDGKYYLTYIREESFGDRAAFEWDIDKKDGKAGILCVSKLTDSLEEIIDMDEFVKKNKKKI